MKYLLPIFLFLSIHLFSQDTLVTISGDTIACKVTKSDLNYVQYEHDGKTSKVPYERVAYMYSDGQWMRNESIEEIDPGESVMKRKPEYTADGISEKQKNHIYSAGIFLKQGSQQYLGGLGIFLLSGIFGAVLAESNPDLALIIAGGGFVVGSVFTISGISKIGKAGVELQSFPYD